MKRYTRKHYNKKLVALGLSVFMGIGLTSTGFAAWVMSQNAKQDVGGSVNVATMTDASVSIQLFKTDSRTEELTKTGEKYTTEDNFVFDAAVGDQEGRLRVSSETGAGEDLEVKIFGTLVENGEVDYEISATVGIPDSIQAAINAGYLVQNELTIEYSEENGNDFVVTISFSWGDKFGGMNPSLYYDFDYTGTEGYDKVNAPKGKDIKDADMKTQMETFWNTITGKTFVWGADEPMTYKDNFNVTLEASPKEVGNS